MGRLRNASAAASLTNAAANADHSAALPAETSTFRVLPVKLEVADNTGKAKRCQGTIVLQNPTGLSVAWSYSRLDVSPRLHLVPATGVLGPGQISSAGLEVDGLPFSMRLCSGKEGSLAGSTHRLCIVSKPVAPEPGSPRTGTVVELWQKHWVIVHFRKDRGGAAEVMVTPSNFGAVRGLDERRCMACDVRGTCGEYTINFTLCKRCSDSSGAQVIPNNLFGFPWRLTEVACGTRNCLCDACSDPTGPTCVVLAPGVCEACKLHPQTTAVRCFLNSLRPGVSPAGAACSGCHQRLNGKICYKPSVGVCDKCVDGSNGTRWMSSCSNLAQALGVMWTQSLDPTAAYQDLCLRCLAFQKTGTGWRLPYLLCEECFIAPPRTVSQTWARLLVNIGMGKSICERAEELAVMPDPWRDEVQRMATRYELAAVAVHELLNELDGSDRQGQKLEALCLAVSLRHGDVAGGRALAALAEYDLAAIRRAGIDQYRRAPSQQPQRRPVIVEEHEPESPKAWSWDGRAVRPPPIPPLIPPSPRTDLMEQNLEMLRKQTAHMKTFGEVLAAVLNINPTLHTEPEILQMLELNVLANPTPQALARNKAINKLLLERARPKGTYDAVSECCKPS